MVAAGSAVGAPTAAGPIIGQSLRCSAYSRQSGGVSVQIAPGEGEATWTVAAAAPTEPHDAPSHKLASPWRNRPRVPAARARVGRAASPHAGDQDIWPPHAHGTAWLPCASAGSPAVGIVAAPSNLCSHEPARDEMDRLGCQSLPQGLGDGTTL